MLCGACKPVRGVGARRWRGSRVCDKKMPETTESAVPDVGADREALCDFSKNKTIYKAEEANLQGRKSQFTRPKKPIYKAEKSQFTAL